MKSLKISIHALLAESDARRASRQQPAGISIHALLAESDRAELNIRQIQKIISIHALLAESDYQSRGSVSMPRYHFYPRSPCGERLWAEPVRNLPKKYFYPRSPCGERQVRYPWTPLTSTISIHALLAESDCSGKLSLSGIRIFLSTLSLRRATWDAILFLPRRLHFYPRSPCGERQINFCDSDPVTDISIHALLAESDTALKTIKALFDTISIHALLAESDPLMPQTRQMRHYFYPRSPCGERHRYYNPG